MNATDFETWLDYHGELFPSLSSWLENRIAKGVVRGWKKAMARTDLADAKQSSDNMLAGDIRRPFLEEEHAAAIIKESRRLKTERLRDVPRKFTPGGKESYRCLECRDEGVRHVWHWRSLKAVQEGKLGNPFTLYSAVVACECQAGEQWRAQKMPVYSDKHFLALVRMEDGKRVCGSVGDKREQDRLSEWVANKAQPKTFDEFTEFS